MLHKINDTQHIIISGIMLSVNATKCPDLKDVSQHKGIQIWVPLTVLALEVKLEVKRPWMSFEKIGNPCTSSFDI